MKYIGIDPGASGGLACIDSEGSIIEHIDMPKLGKEIDLYSLRDFILDHKDGFFLVEKCQYTPAVRGKGAYTFGMAVMAINAACAVLDVKHEFVRPQKWKKEFELINKDKYASIQKAIQLFPEHRKFLNFKTKDGRSESLLLAEYARRKY